MAPDPATEHEIQDLAAKNTAKDLNIRDQTLRHSLDVQEYEEQPNNYDPKCVPHIVPNDTLLTLINADCGPSAASGWSCHWLAGSAWSAPLSEQFGRKIVSAQEPSSASYRCPLTVQVLDISTAIFAIWELACALAPNITSLLIFRIFSGLGGSACLSIGGGIVSDLFDSNERGVATAVFALGPLLGPVIGPIVGGFLSQEAGWRWVTTIAPDGHSVRD
ncbi:hypothetical protein KVR01_009251 [Diaporthe batatas]|uniref:uncharacterized protein n=1 Tax=Diaporthe batatas TaxID=748121 RepID=UPI001D04E5CE|nr:uncharacterized protein KVR01_009251 [Diaporthe batatas]KAG8160987.1 hypothetical protein KVR01_009251 [Diaporthe batatas]